MGACSPSPGSPVLLVATLGHPLRRRLWVPRAQHLHPTAFLGHAGQAGSSSSKKNPGQEGRRRTAVPRAGSRAALSPWDQLACLGADLGVHVGLAHSWACHKLLCALLSGSCSSLAVRKRPPPSHHGLCACLGPVAFWQTTGPQAAAWGLRVPGGFGGCGTHPSSAPQSIHTSPFSLRSRG